MGTDDGGSQVRCGVGTDDGGSRKRTPSFLFIFFTLFFFNVTCSLHDRCGNRCCICEVLSYT